MDTAVSVELFVEILNRYVYYFEMGNETVRIFFLFLYLSFMIGQRRRPHGPPVA
jgi:hypothetical protein